MATGFVYTASFASAPVINVPQSLWEILPPAGTTVLLRSLRIAFVPNIISGVPQDVRAQISIRMIIPFPPGSGGISTTPVAVDARNTVTPATTINRLVTTPSGTGSVLSSEIVSILAPYEPIRDADFGRGVGPLTIRSPGLAVSLDAGLGGTFIASSDMTFEELL